MFIYNLKLSGTKLYKIIFAIIILLVLLLCIVVAHKLYKASFRVNDEIKNNDILQINNDNYASILKSVHENIDDYVGKKIIYSGFVYRVYDLNDNQFVLARNMIINSNNQTVVVGFLCDYEKAKDLKDNSWVSVDGIITKGKYHGDMPILQINNIQIIDKPEDCLVPPPNDNYISNL